MSRYTYEQFTAVRNYDDISFSPDGKWIAYSTNASGQYNVWKQQVEPCADGTPKMPYQLTAMVDRCARRVVWSPDGKIILTAADILGNENFQLYAIPPESGWIYPITNSPEVRHEIGDNPFSPDGRYIAYSTNKREPSDLDVIVHDLETQETQILVSGDANYFPISWSPDGRYILVLKFNTSTDQDLYLCKVDTGEIRHLSSNDGEIRFIPGPWSADSVGFYIITDKDREFLGLAYFNIHANSTHWIEAPNWDIEDVDISQNARYIAFVVNKEGYSSLYVRNTGTNEMFRYPDLPQGVYRNLRFIPFTSFLGLYISRPVHPTDIYILNVETRNFWKLTQSFVGGIPETEMIEPKLIRYPTHDEQNVPSFLYKPVGLCIGEGSPVIVSIHGGPEAQELPVYQYNGFYQYLLHLGIGILGTNIRGSTGYGKTYQKLIRRDWGGSELKDLEHAALYLRGLDWVDPTRLGVFGASFGGFAALSCVSRLPEYWAAAIDIMGPSNLVTFAKTVSPVLHRFIKQEVGDAEKDADLLRERSPITYVDNVHAPLLVIQGAKDPRVVKAESDQMVESLKKLGREVEYVIFEDEGHGFTKTTNWLKALKISGDFFEKHLGR